MNRQNGFTLVEGLLIVLILCVVGFAGYTVWNNNQEGESTIPDASTKEMESTHNNESDDGEDTPGQETPNLFITEIEAVTISNEDDLRKLPEFTPETFVEYLRTAIKSSDSVTDGCATSYGVSKISPYNINGGSVPTDIDNPACGSGAPIVWVLSPDGKWDEESRNGTSCVSSGGGLVYEEFAAECSDSNNNWIPNPNGSVLKADS